MNQPQSDKIIMNLKSVSKTYPSFQLGPIDAQINSSDIIALVGKNGSGKSTLLRILTGSMDSSSGVVTFCNKVLKPESYLLKRSLGYLPQNLFLPKWSSATEILSYALRLYEIDDRSKVDESLKYWDALNYRYLPMGACSHGMQKRIALALATLSDPELLILDEPFSGLDLYHIRALTDMICHRTQMQKATLICTHMIPYAARLCNNVWIMNNGKLSTINDWSSKDSREKSNLIEEAILTE